MGIYLPNTVHNYHSNYNPLVENKDEDRLIRDNEYHDGGHQLPLFTQVFFIRIDVLFHTKGH